MTLKHFFEEKNLKIMVQSQKVAVFLHGVCHNSINLEDIGLKLCIRIH